MPAATQNFVLEQGVTQSFTVQWLAAGNPVDLTGATAKMQLRQAHGIDPVLDELSTANGRIVITPLTGTLALSFSAATTEAYQFNSAVYDIKITDISGNVTRLLQGGINVSFEVTE